MFEDFLTVGGLGELAAEILAREVLILMQTGAPVGAGCDIVNDTVISDIEGVGVGVVLGELAEVHEGI